jgi:hypothetical protein
MKESTESQFHGIHYYRSSDDPQTFFFQPEKPGAQKDPRGRPVLSLLASDQGALLQLGAEWGVDDQLLARFKHYLARHFHLDPSLIRLSPAPLSVEKVVLALGDGAGNFDELATSSSSGYPPYSAIFNVKLTTEQKANVISALNSRRDFLKITYLGLASLSGGEPVRLEQSTDISDWFAGGSGLDHILAVGATIGSPESATQQGPAQQSALTVKLGFDAKEAPIAFVQVKCADVQSVLRGSTFDPVMLTGATAGQPLHVKTSYTESGPPFEAILPAAGPEGWVLAPPDLGLACIVADASSCRDAGGREARLYVRYRPSGNGNDDERTIYLRGNDWICTWFLITRSRDLSGVLEFQWKDTAADGSSNLHPLATTDQQELKL